MPEFTRRRGRSLNRKRNKTLRPSNRRVKSQQPYKNIINEEIGFGSFGIVSRPPSRCDSYLSKNFNQDVFREAYYGNPNYVSKLTEFTGADRELKISEVIKDTIPNYMNFFCLIEFICNAPESKSIERNGDYYGTYAIAPYCGVPLDEYLREDIESPITVFELCHLVPACQTMIRGLQKLHLKHIYHKDIHPGNVLYDSESGLMRLIDFGLADDLRDKDDDNIAVIYDEFHDCDQLVQNIIKPLLEVLLNSRITSTRVWIKYPYIEDFCYSIKQFYGKIDTFLNPHRKPYFSQVDREQQLTRLLNVVHYFKEIKSINELAEKYYENIGDN